MPFRKHLGSQGQFQTKEEGGVAATRSQGLGRAVKVALVPRDTGYAGNGFCWGIWGQIWTSGKEPSSLCQGSLVEGEGGR